MRGEHMSTSAMLTGLPGSSPHARGTLGLVVLRLHGRGIIPACAGNTCWLKIELYGNRDHPRMRGEHAPYLYCDSQELGSSPHARGTLEVIDAVQKLLGIIPACAGNTNRQPVSHKHVRDHPRMRGEHPLTPKDEVMERGSSPHARGTPIHPV